MSQDLSIRGWKNSSIFLRITIIEKMKRLNEAKKLTVTYFLKPDIKWIVILNAYKKKLWTDMTVKIIKIHGSHPPTNLGNGRLNNNIIRNEIVSHTSI